jgi:hypothetical protein
MDNLYLGCYWKDRKEDADACTKRIVQCLKGVATCDQGFAEVFLVPKSYKSPYRIPVDCETLKPLVEKGRNREDVPPRKVIEKLGYSISFVSGDDYRNRDTQWSMRTMCGAYPQTPGLSNYCALSLPKKGEALEALLRPEKLTCLLRTMIDAWEPDWAIVQGSKLQDYVRQGAGIPPQSPQRAFLGWMAYFANRVGKVPDELPVYSKLNLEQGTLLTLTPELIELDRPDHENTVRAVLSGLQNAGLIPA